LGGEWADLSGLAKLPYNRQYLNTEMPNGSKMIMSLFHIAYLKRTTGHPAFGSDGGVTAGLMRSFQVAAYDVSNEPYDCVNQDEAGAYE
jgi:hypothetical protein